MYRMCNIAVVMSFREWLRTLLEEGVYETQEQMAADFGTKQSTIAHYLRGSRLPDVERCGLISEATGKPVADIVEMVRRSSNSKPVQRGRTVVRPSRT